MIIEIETETADRTREVGQALASMLEPRDTVVLTGDLGAGKTTLVQGIGRGLDVEDHVAFPTSRSSVSTRAGWTSLTSTSTGWSGSKTFSTWLWTSSAALSGCC